MMRMGATPEAAVFTPADIRRARAAGGSVLAALEELHPLPAEDFAARLAASFGFPLATMQDLNVWQPAFDVVPFSDCLKQQIIAFRGSDSDAGLRMVLGDPFRAGTREWAAERVNTPCAWHLAHHTDVSAYLARYEETLSAMDSVLLSAGAASLALAGVEDLSFQAISEDVSPVVKLVHSTLYDALKAGASDIHLETGAAQLAIKYRIDGVLSHVGTISSVELAEQVISRIKVMSELDIAERRVPQDGRFKVAVRGRQIDFRVSVMPSIFGEDAVLRILDKQTLSDQVKGLCLDNLGFDAQSMAVIRRLSNEPYGMVLLTGPTGSGKTTTLYAAITEINHGRDKIITIEDPVEYQLAGVLQIPVNEKKGLTFARGLRSILRHDPDKVMVGEIRDSDTAQIAVQAALTGHLVFTSVHANNVFDVIGRFMHMGIDPYSFVAALNGVVAQRLVRVICDHCAVEMVPDEQELKDSGLDAQHAGDFAFRSGVGCGHCRGSGYRGRKAIAEYLVLNDELRDMIVAREPMRRIKDAARTHGTRLLRQSALEAVRTGQTDLREINRVTFVA